MGEALSVIKQREQLSTTCVDFDVAPQRFIFRSVLPKPVLHEPDS